MSTCLFSPEESSFAKVAAIPKSANHATNGDHAFDVHVCAVSAGRRLCNRYDSSRERLEHGGN